MNKRPAIFLDRDGVLCVEKGYVTGKEDLEIFPYTASCIARFHQKGFLAICITNQSAVARGLMTEKTLREIHAYLIQETGLDALYYCPHHPEGTGVYAEHCECRKPNTGMVEQAIREFGIDRAGSWMLGDRASDILCGQRAGLTTVLLESGYGLRRLEEPVEPDFVFRDLQEYTAAFLEMH